MRTVTYGGAVSLDGFLAGPGGTLDWLHWSEDVGRITSEYFKGVDVILMGRKTWAGAEAQTSGSKPRSGKSSSKRSAKPPKMQTYVFSRTLKPIDRPGVTVVSDDAAAFVRDLKQRPGGRICLMGGGELAQSLIAADLVDEIGLNIHPVLLGSGVPVFRDPGHRVKLALVETRSLSGGCILATYQRAGESRAADAESTT
jgi:dihydrofolate reductase